MQQHLGRLDGVVKVEVNLADGAVTVQTKDDPAVDPAKVFKATYDSGVSVAEMTIVAEGTIELDKSGRPVFRISDKQVFEVAANTLSGAKGRVTIRGRLYKKVGKKTQKTLGVVRLEILEVIPK